MQKYSFEHGVKYIGYRLFLSHLIFTIMEKKQYKTTINCANCVRKVTPFLNDIPNIKWSIDTKDPDKILTVEGENLNEEYIIGAVEEAGFDVILPPGEDEEEQA